ncbi:MAG: TIR domain-containing protein [Anaerolineales bacterium]|nr:MAG: TIR domain-containing protein [Anaerolineales bacterium]
MIGSKGDTTGPVGRFRELQQVDRQLRRARDIIVISPPITGLSTFLTQVQRHITTAEHFIPFRVLYLDCQELPRGREPFINLFCRAVLDELELVPTVHSEQQGDRLVEFLDQLLIANDELCMVLIIDNLQAVPEREIRILLEQIRVVSESRLENRSLKRVLFILGGQCLDLRKLDPDHTSPFNIAEKIFLKDLNESDALELVNQLLSRSARPYSQLAAKYICHLTGGHPYLLTQVCSHLIHDTVPATMAAQRIDFGAIEKVVEAMCDDGGDRLLRQMAAALEDLSAPALECLRKILNGVRYDSDKDAPPLRELALLGLICSSKSPVWPVWQARNLIYDRYLRQQSCLAPVVGLGSFVPRRLFVNVEGYRLLFQLENDLRHFVFSKMFDKFGDQWWQRVDERIATYCQGLKEKELESRWFSNENLPDLAYSQFPHLKKVIDDNWPSIFHQYFKPKSIFVGFFDTLEGFRNKLAHNRPLTDKEIEQLETIARQFRNCMYDDVPMGRADDAQCERETAASILQDKIATGDFDVFLCHNSADKPAVKEIGERLKKRGILPWLDEWELQPGLPWQRLLEEQIAKIKSAAVFVGKDGIGPWHRMELEAFLREFVDRGCPVIPVLLPDAPQKPQLPIFLKGMTWVDFRKEDPDPTEQLIWGITGERDGALRT